MSIKGIFHDPIHKEIVFDSGKPEELMIMELIDTIAFQRLRRIKQLGAASLLFHGAESSRFTHSIGVFCIARKIYNRLIESKSSFCENKFILYGAALLHDLGHGPLSHTSEAIFDHNHEQWSRNLVENYSPINSILKKYDNELPRQIGELFQTKQLFSKPLKTLISSEIDCDRLDYLLRDSYNTGTKYGLVDLERIISALTFSPDGNIAIKPKGMIAIEHFLVLRNLMYRTIYNHRINEISTWILEKIIYTIKNKSEKKIWLDKSLSKWIFSPTEINFDDFIRNDDITFYYHLIRWKDESFKPLSTLCKMFIDRDLLKASDISFLNKIDRLNILAFARKLCEENNYDSEIFCGIKERSFKGFESNNALKIWDGIYQSSLENSSELIKTLMKSQESAFIIYPNVIKDKINKQISLIRNKFIV
ncbi:HD family phosphohydrolase [Prochlorococcus marinus str. MU1404]|uniref:HD domain-containing protein n=1 Tax=Prochlorococcus marinus TaxID=1219 RepID=UPI001ADA7443|nr:HD domain-containing protein [Prochlorococcus marinus]MBO8229496.1 HD domain-containing protein [Prochlorococcus marinus XMU1404]MBW3072579.1 HD family phosphohydrolase [Prochlorococcus marinus str. MU1404]MCR8546168.1 HD domain-containing protein [Prochlorococcus marinus CUG1432]